MLSYMGLGLQPMHLGDTVHDVAATDICLGIKLPLPGGAAQWLLLVSPVHMEKSALPRLHISLASPSLCLDSGPLWMSSSHLTLPFCVFVTLGLQSCFSSPEFIYFLFIFIFIFLVFLPFPVAYGGSQARNPNRAVAAGLCQSHSNVGSEPHLRPTPQLTAMLDP